VDVGGGWFLMGSEDETDPLNPGYDLRRTESPRHWVYVDDFSIGRYPVTFEEYDRFCESTGRLKPPDEGWGRGRRPVIHVTWYDAEAYCAWLAEKTGRDFRLPTEAEWEYACRAGSRTVYFWGDIPSARHANGHNDPPHPWPPDGHEHTSPVGSFLPNAFGLYDMLGNVHEWCLDFYDKQYYRYAPERNPLKSHRMNSSQTLIRGGSWRHSYELRPGYRGWWWRSEPGLSVIGFRVARPARKNSD
ncbi:SUMF1/EgtB/PvdO family nonheme iron enzyme, partial [bacterium]|nr:SUMF1/EgtB/PvdO family nonheme iron enzyme [bacterium]